MAASDKKRIIVRLDEKTWTAYDNKRHSERLSWQQLGGRLFADWYSEKTLSSHAPAAADALPNSPEPLTNEVVLHSQVLTALVRPDTNQEDMVTLVLSRDESEWVFGLLEVLRCESPGVATWIQGNIKVFRDWVKVQQNERPSDSLPAPVATPGIQGGVGGGPPRDTEADRAAKSALRSISRVKESFDPAQDRGAEPAKKTPGNR